MWEVDNRLFEMNEGYRRIGPVDWFKHNSRVNLISDASMILGVRVSNFVEKNLPISKQDFLLHISDAMDYLYQSSPSGSVYLDEKKENKFIKHLSEKEQKEIEKFDSMRVLNPMIDKFHAWRALYENFAIAVLSDPNIAKERRFSDDLTYQLIRDRLVKLNGVDMPSEMFGDSFQPYYKQLEAFIKNKNLLQEQAKLASVNQNTESKKISIFNKNPAYSSNM